MPRQPSLYLQRFPFPLPTCSLRNYTIQQMKAHVEGSLFVTDNQRSWTKTQLIMRRLKPTRRRQSPADPVGAWCFRLVHRTWFDPTVMVLIVLNTVVMAMEYFGQSSTYTRCGPSPRYFHLSVRLRLLHLW